MITANHVLALEKSRIAALLARDTDTLTTLVAPDCTYVHSTGFVDGGSNYVDKVRRGTFVYDAIEVDQQMVHTMTDVAIVVFRMRVSVRVDGVPRKGTSRCTAVWTADDDVHLLRAFHATPIPAE